MGERELVYKYKGFEGVIDGFENGLWHGHTRPIAKEVITFSAHLLSELGHEFRESVDDYLEFCEQKPNEPHRRRK